MHRSLLIAIALLSTLVSGCSIALPSSVSIRNASKSPITDVVVNFAGKMERVEVVGSGDTVTLRRRPSHDGGIVISYTSTGLRLSETLAYVAPPFRTICQITIEDRQLRKDCTAG
jgi:hypothetical protein